ncbi:unnamed protein product [Polarella glacialis]|uniref:glucan endo-1,3-beta-D-glucosidase n=1 Tax=Polarella glacialis TaxID=89957 RepID=A0A813HLZ1_POLGL|nr:unnamed protein product [Polarella glacialis]
MGFVAHLILACAAAAAASSSCENAGPCPPARRANSLELPLNSNNDINNNNSDNNNKCDDGSATQLCGHGTSSCVSSAYGAVIFDEACASGGLGCSALGKLCCRFCGFGAYSSIPCRSSDAIPCSLTGTTATTATSTPFPGSSTISSVQPVVGPATSPPPLDGSLLKPVATNMPDSRVFPPVHGHRLPPAHTEVSGPKATNKFWANWVVSSGIHLPIFPMPYVLKWGTITAGMPPALMVSHGQQVYAYGDAATNGPERIRSYSTPCIGEFGLGAVEETSGESVIVKEGLFGIHVEVRGPAGTSRKIVFPIFSGMAYVSGRYEGGFTPRVTSERALLEVQKIQDGVWRFRNNGGTEFRVYALTFGGDLVDSSFDFDPSGTMTRTLEGWLRVARVSDAQDAAVLDAHASAVLVDWKLQVDVGRVRYAFTKKAATGAELLHFAYAHHVKLLAGGAQRLAQNLSPIRSPTKGSMAGVIGDSWLLQVDLAEADGLGFLPPGEPDSPSAGFLKAETLGTWQYFQEGSNWRADMFKGSYYFSGKGFQKVGTVCLLLEKFFGLADSNTQACADVLATGFKCLYDREHAGDCAGAPIGSYYDSDWGGIPSKEGFHDDGCLGGADFGNACYNDHHYHFGYFVVSAAILLKLKPALAANNAFVSYVETLVRDTTNPSSEDIYFPLFRSFDWFDLHSWSRGVVPSADGKDQESTSEELNLLYGIHLWAGLLGNTALQKLGATMLSLCAMTVREFFLMEKGNPHHHKDFVKNHVTGIYSQNRADYATWFGWREEFIHGIQMLPLSPALQLTRKAHFCRQEWDTILGHLPLSLTDPWTSIILTGTLAIIEPARAYEHLQQMLPDSMDDGLTRVWALYWAAVQGSVPPKFTTTQQRTLVESSSVISTQSTASSPKATIFLAWSTSASVRTITESSSTTVSQTTSMIASSKVTTPSSESSNTSHVLHSGVKPEFNKAALNSGLLLAIFYAP